MKIHIKDQIQCVKRELNMRYAVYPRQVENKKISQAAANYEIGAMRAVLETLLEVQKQNNDLPLFQ